MASAKTGSALQADVTWDEAGPRTTFADDVRRGLSVRPFRIPSQYLYDALGSSLFEAICDLPWYPITRAEKRLLFQHAHEILGAAHRPLTIVELGCGTGEKLDLLLEAWDGAYDQLAVTLVDVSATALQQSARLIAAKGPARVTCHRMLYEEGLARTGGAHAGGRLVLFLGSNIGNFDPDEARRFLARIRGGLTMRDFLLIGVDLVKPERVLQLAYDDPLGVTAAFNLNLLVRMNRELGADFDLQAFAHRAVWRAAEQRVEMHLVSRRRQRVRVTAAGCEATLEPGESLWTECSYKYTLPDIDTVLRGAGLAVSERWIDEEAAFALLLVQPSDDENS